jgi:hypothetical protein
MIVSETMKERGEGGGIAMGVDEGVERRSLTFRVRNLLGYIMLLTIPGLTKSRVLTNPKWAGGHWLGYADKPRLRDFPFKKPSTAPILHRKSSHFWA